MRLVSVLPLLAVVVISCWDPLAPNAVGLWGGEHMSLDISSTDAIVEYDCAHGAILQAIHPDKDGRFSAVGNIVIEHGGPALIDEELPTFPARYAGRIDVNTMTLTVTRTDSAKTIGTYTLQRGARGRVFKCL